MRTTLKAIHTAAVAAVNPATAVQAHCHLEGDLLIVDKKQWDLNTYERIVILGGGKASAPMGAALEKILGERISAGLIVVKYGHTCPTEHIVLREAAHPVPDEQSHAATEEIVALAHSCTEKDLVICCLSGGASALLCAPHAPMTLADKQTLTQQLLGSGVDIHAMNTVRKHVSQVKGGGLAQAIAPATLINLLISDVVGDSLSSIGSGPIVGDPSSLAEARNIVATLPNLAVCVSTVLADASHETPTEDDPVFEQTSNHLIATNAQACAAARQVAEEHGYMVVEWDGPMTGDAAEMAVAFCERLKSLPAQSCLLAGGETTVQLGENPGLGGRCQEFALASTLHLQADPAYAVLAAGTDGNDGPCDACGAFALPETLAAAAAHDLDAQDFFSRHDAYHFYSPIDGLHKTGPTNTNVMDIYIGLKN